MTIIIAASVTPASTGAAPAGAPGGCCENRPNMTGASVTGISMMMVLETVGVISRRRLLSRRAILMSGRHDNNTRVASRAGPPSFRAAMETAMYAADGPIRSRCPEPNRRRRVVCNMVVRPLTSKPANTAHDR